MSTPRFSFTVPATRSHLLQYSVGSILAQEIGDLEIIISDNSPNGMRDQVEAFGDRRIRYVRPPKALSHYKNWEFAHSHAAGDWVILLADDDVVVPSLLRHLSKVQREHPEAEIVSWAHGSFVSGTYLSKELQGQISLPKVTGRLSVSDNRKALKAIYSMGGTPSEFSQAKRAYPSPMLSAYALPLAQRIRSRCGALFNPTTPDWAAGVAAMASTRFSLFLDMPLTVLQTTSDSFAATSAGDATKLKELLKLYDEPPLRDVPFDGMIPNRNWIADTIMGMKRRLPEELGEFELDYASYFENVYYCLADVRKRVGPEHPFRSTLDDEFARFLVALSLQPITIRERLDGYMKVLDGTLGAVEPRRSYLLRRIYRLVVGLQLRAYPFARTALIDRLSRAGFSTTASIAGVRDILQFAAIAGKLIDDVLAAASTREEIR